jgi:hypothetical protein
MPLAMNNSATASRARPASDAGTGIEFMNGTGFIVENRDVQGNTPLSHRWRTLSYGRIWST